MAFAALAPITTLTAVSKTTFGDPVIANFNAMGLIQIATDTTERTTTSTSTVTLSTLTPDITITASRWLYVVALIRKSTGAGAAVSMGLKLNTTQIIPDAAFFSANNQIEMGTIEIFIPPRVTGYLQGAWMRSYTKANTNTIPLTTRISTASVDAPTANITSIILTATSGDALVTAACDEVRAYVLGAA